MARRQTGSPGRAASFFLLLGCCTVLGTTFAAGMLAGRHWPGLFPALGPGSAAKAERETQRNGRALAPRQGLGLPASSLRPEPGPELTFYQELTAPLGAPQPGPKPKADRPERPPTRGEPARTEPPRPDPKPAAGTEAKADAKSEGPELPRPEPRAGTPAAERRFTIQVAAFKTRDQADAMRAKLAAAGHEAYVMEADGVPGARFRVRVGSFATRDEARQAAQRISATTYVTLR